MKLDISNVDEFFVLLDDTISIVFIYLKYVLFIVLVAVGSLTLLKLRGVYLRQREKGVKNEDDQLKNDSSL